MLCVKKLCLFDSPVIVLDTRLHELFVQQIKTWFVFSLKLNVFLICHTNPLNWCRKICMSCAIYVSHLLSHPRNRNTNMAMLFLKCQRYIQRRWLSLKKRCSLLLIQRRRCLSQVYGSFQLGSSRHGILDSLLSLLAYCVMLWTFLSLHFPVICFSLHVCQL